MVYHYNMMTLTELLILVSKERIKGYKMINDELMKRLLEVRDTNEEKEEKDPLKTKKPKELKGEKFNKLQKMEAKVNEQDDEDDLLPEEPEDEALEEPEREKPEREGPREKPEGEEVPEITKEYVGNTEDTHYYLISNEDEEGNVEDLQIVDQEGVKKFSARANAIETENVPEFLFKAIQELRIESIEFGIFSTYLYPYVFEKEEEEGMEEAPEDLDQMEEEPEESKKVESKSPLTEMKVTDHENNMFNVQLVDDGTMDTVIDINGREFRFDAEFASYWRDEDGSMTEEGLKQLALDALSSMEEEEYNKLVVAVSVSEEESEEVPEKEKANEYESKTNESEDPPEPDKTNEAKMGIDYVKAAKASMKKAASAMKDKDHEAAIKSLEDVADDAADAAKALKKMKREDDAKAAAEAEKEKNEATTEEGKDNPGVRDGTGPAKGSAQRSISKKGKRKERGEKCPNETKVEETTVEDVSQHVQDYARYMGDAGDATYLVEFGGKTYTSNDTWDLVVQICRDKGIACESKTNEGEGDLAGSTKEVYEVEFEKEGKKETTRVMAFGEGEAKKMLDDKPGVTALSAKLITSESKEVDEDVKQVLPGTYRVMFYDGHKEDIEADSKVDAMNKAREKHSGSLVSNVELVHQLGKRRDVQFDKDEGKTSTSLARTKEKKNKFEEETKEQKLTKSLLDLLG